MHKPKYKINGFNYPASDQISGRTSTICRSMACTLLQRDKCTFETETQWKSFFPDKTCAYCGKPASHLDHLYPLIADRKPTGYGTEPANLVPCCKDCNQKKGNLPWKEYMLSDKCQHLPDSQTGDITAAMQNRIAVLQAFQTQMPPRHIQLSAEDLAEWESILTNFDEALNNAQLQLLSLKDRIYGESN